MTQEKRELLLKDLCARVPYDTVVKVDGLGDAYLDSVSWFEEVALRDYTPTTYSIENVQPYLRPMSSMTDEEMLEFGKLGWRVDELDNNNPWNIDRGILCVMDGVDWLNAHHFDYRNLIGAGLALEAPEGMYVFEL